MKINFKNFCTKLKQIPSPPVKPGLLGKIMGHFKEMNDITKTNQQNIKSDNK